MENARLRRQYLALLADAILEVNSLDGSQWALTAHGEIPRLVVGHYYTYSLDDVSKGIWLAFDTESLESCSNGARLPHS